MKLRVLAIGALVLLPVAVLIVVLSLGDDGPQRLPVTAAVLNQRDALAAEDGAPGVRAVGYEPGPDLPDQGGEGRAYRLASSTDTDRVASVAAVLGIEGDPVLDGSGSWEVRGGDGAFLGVQSTPGLRWWYAPNELQSPVEILGSEEAVRPDDLPPEDEAVAIALELVSSMAIDTRGAEVRASDQGAAWTVTVDPTVDGLPTAGFASLVTIGPGGRVLVASGFLATPEAADEYPLADLGTALDRLNAAGGSVVPPPIMPEVPPRAVVPPAFDCGAMAGGAPTTAAPPPGCEAGVPTTVTAEGVPGATVVPGEDGLEPPEKAVLTSVTRALIFSASLDGRHGWLVPAYRFDADNGDRPVVSAVADDFLLDGVSAQIDSGRNVGGGAGPPGGAGGPVTTAPAAVTSVAPPTTG